MPTDAELFAAARQNDQAAFATLMRRHRGWAEAYARKCGAGAEADDIAQDAFFKLLRSDQTQLHNDSLRSLLSVDIRFRVLRLSHRRARQAGRPPGSELPEPGTGLSEVARRRRVLSHVLEAMERMRSSQRRLLQMRYIDGLRPVEIAARSGRSDAAIRAALFRARQSLKLELAPRLELET